MAHVHRAWTSPPSDFTVPLARRRVVDALHAGGWDERVVDDAALITTELVTNAVLHARDEYTVTIDLTGQTLRVEVEDTAEAPPGVDVTRPVDSGSGRGMLLVRTLADAWGVETRRGGKLVWFELTRV
jgi:anti-sigma regulatory factor (Ser/Thr protein kinase)